MLRKSTLLSFHKFLKLMFGLLHVNLLGEFDTPDMRSMNWFLLSETFRHWLFGNMELSWLVRSDVLGHWDRYTCFIEVLFVDLLDTLFNLFIVLYLFRDPITDLVNGLFDGISWLRHGLSWNILLNWRPWVPARRPNRLPDRFPNWLPCT